MEEKQGFLWRSFVGEQCIIRTNPHFPRRLEHLRIIIPQLLLVPFLRSLQVSPRIIKNPSLLTHLPQSCTSVQNLQLLRIGLLLRLFFLLPSRFSAAPVVIDEFMHTPEFRKHFVEFVPVDAMLVLGLATKVWKLLAEEVIDEGVKSGELMVHGGEG